MKRIKYLEGSIAGLHDYRRIDGEMASWGGYLSFRDEVGNRYYLELIDRLVRNQHGICGYCEIRLDNDDLQVNSLHVEHVVPRSICAELEFEGTNLIASCSGRSTEISRNSSSKDSLSCGHKKGNRVLPDIADPRKIPCLPSLLIVSSDGMISGNSELIGELGLEMHEVSWAIELLGLNAGRLKVMRRNLWRELEQMVMSEVEEFGTKAERLERSKELALKFLIPEFENGELPQFFTTIRSFFKEVAEKVLSDELPKWI